MGGDFKTIIHVYYQYVIFLLNDNKSISDRHMIVVANIRAPVISTSRCSYFIDKNHSSIIMSVFNAIRFKTDLCVYFGY
jgi:hypothetical protein